MHSTCVHVSPFENQSPNVVFLKKVCKRVEYTMYVRIRITVLSRVRACRLPYVNMGTPCAGWYVVPFLWNNKMNFMLRVVH